MRSTDCVIAKFATAHILLSSLSPAAAVAAASKLISNHAAVAADAVNTDPKTQKDLQRIDPASVGHVDAVLLEASERLLGVAATSPEPLAAPEAIEPPDAAVRAKAARYVCARLCAPRDMGPDAASALRAVLAEIAARYEGYAWRASGGLL